MHEQDTFKFLITRRHFEADVGTFCRLERRFWRQCFRGRTCLERQWVQYRVNNSKGRSKIHLIPKMEMIPHTSVVGCVD